MAIFFEAPQASCFWPDFDQILHVSSLGSDETIEFNFLKIGPLRAEIVGGGAVLAPSRYIT